MTRARKAGFSLVELFVSLTFIAIVLSWGYRFVTKQARQAHVQTSTIQTSIDVQQAMSRLEADIRSSGTNYSFGGATSKSNDMTFQSGGKRYPYGLNPAFSGTHKDLFALYQCLGSGPGCLDWGLTRASEKLVYRVKNGNLLRVDLRPSGDLTQVLLEGIEFIEVEFFDVDQNWLGKRRVTAVPAEPRADEFPSVGSPNFIDTWNHISSLSIAISQVPSSGSDPVRITRRVTKPIRIYRDEM